VLFPLDDATPHVSGGRLCLGHVNTVLWRRSAEPEEKLTSYAELVRYVARAGWLDSADELIAIADTHPRRAGRALERALSLRELLFGLFSELAAGRQPEPAALASLNELLAESMSHLRLSPTTDGFEAGWEPHHDLDLPVWQVTTSAGALLASDDLARLKQCPGERCGWVFVDESRNQSRRWCDPTMCGNRARVRAHYQRTRLAAG
jgi:predicted RNA-binding Zn ribbon-like protein